MAHRNHLAAVVTAAVVTAFAVPNLGRAQERTPPRPMPGYGEQPTNTQPSTPPTSTPPTVAPGPPGTPLPTGGPMIDPAAIGVPLTLVAVDQDGLVPSADISALAEQLPGSSFHLIHSRYGHDAFLKEAAEVGAIIGTFLNSLELSK